VKARPWAIKELTVANRLQRTTAADKDSVFIYQTGTVFNLEFPIWIPAHDLHRPFP